MHCVHYIVECDIISVSSAYSVRANEFKSIYCFIRVSNSGDNIQKYVLYDGQLKELRSKD